MSHKFSHIFPCMIKKILDEGLFSVCINGKIDCNKMLGGVDLSVDNVLSDT
jgi:hypothetical protein